MAKVSRSGFRIMSDSSIRTNPSIDEPSNMISPSSAFSNWLSGTSTFFTAPVMSVNCRRRNRTSCSRSISSTSSLPAPFPRRLFSSETGRTL